MVKKTHAERVKGKGRKQLLAKLTKKLLYCLDLKKRQIFGYHGHQRILHPSCHPSLARYSASSTLRCCDGMDLLQDDTKAREKKKVVIFGHVLASLCLFIHTDTVTKKCCKNPPAHTQTVLYKHVTVTVVHGFTTDGLFYGQGGARSVVRYDRRTKSIGCQMPFEEKK